MTCFSPLLQSSTNPRARPPYLWMVLAPFATSHSVHYSCHNCRHVWLIFQQSHFSVSGILLYFSHSLLRFFSRLIVSTLHGLNCMHPLRSLLVFSLIHFSAPALQIFLFPPIYNPLIPLPLHCLSTSWCFSSLHSLNPIASHQSYSLHMPSIPLP